MEVHKQGAVEAKTEVDAKVAGLLVELFQMPAAQVTDEMAMKDVEVWDSLKHMELIVALEQAFDIELTFDEIVAMQNVREIKRVLGDRSALK